MSVFTYVRTYPCVLSRRRREARKTGARVTRAKRRRERTRRWMGASWVQQPGIAPRLACTHGVHSRRRLSVGREKKEGGRERVSEGTRRSMDRLDYAASLGVASVINVAAGGPRGFMDSARKDYDDRSTIVRRRHRPRRPRSSTERKIAVRACGGEMFELRECTRTK